MPELYVLATSRQALGLPSEVVYPLGPLPVPTGQTTVDDLARFDSVRLFADRAVAARPSFQLTDASAADIAALVARLDGVPLAIELAAARVGALSVAEIRARLADRFDLLSRRGGVPGPHLARSRRRRNGTGTGG